MTIPSNTAITEVRPAWTEAVRNDLEQVTEKMRTVSKMDNAFLDASIEMILTAGGKRMRPALTLLVGRACNAPYEQVLSVAASVELLHTATLVHDDLVDNAEERRNSPTLHTQLPLGLTVLTGDFLFAQSAALAAEAANVRVVQVFADTLVTICKGEILQAQTRWKVSDMAGYHQRIYGKTAALFEAAAISAAILGDISEDAVQTYATFGRELGLAFQIVDDALDFVASSQKLGKPAGHDLREGYITLPAMLYIEQNELDKAEFVEQARNPRQVEELVIAIREQGAAREALQMARGHIQKAENALDNLDWVPAMEPLMGLTEYVVARDF